MFLIADFIALLLLQMRIEIKTHFFCIAVKPSEDFVKVSISIRCIRKVAAWHGPCKVPMPCMLGSSLWAPYPAESRACMCRCRCIADPQDGTCLCVVRCVLFFAFFWGGEGWGGWAKRWVQCGWTSLCARKRLESQSKWICSHIVWILSAMYIHMHKYHISIVISRSLFLSLCRIDEIHRHEKTCFLLHPPDASSMSHGV